MLYIVFILASYWYHIHISYSCCRHGDVQSIIKQRALLSFVTDVKLVVAAVMVKGIYNTLYIAGKQNFWVCLRTLCPVYSTFCFPHRLPCQVATIEIIYEKKFNLKIRVPSKPVSSRKCVDFFVCLHIVVSNCWCSS